MTNEVDADRGRAAIKAATKSAMVFLLPPFDGPAARDRALAQAYLDLQLVIENCVRGGRLDQAMKLQDIGLAIRI